MRELPLSMRKANLARLLARRPDGIFIAPFEEGEIGPAGCKLPTQTAGRGVTLAHQEKGRR
jgi:bifunctional non-homologous end joining protein LigD